MFFPDLSPGSSYVPIILSYLLLLLVWNCFSWLHSRKSLGVWSSSLGMASSSWRGSSHLGLRYCSCPSWLRDKCFLHRGECWNTSREGWQIVIKSYYVITTYIVNFCILLQSSMIENDSQLPNCIFVFILYIYICITYRISTYDEESMVPACLIRIFPHIQTKKECLSRGATRDQWIQWIPWWFLPQKSYLDVLRCFAYLFHGQCFGVVGAENKWPKIRWVSPLKTIGLVPTS